MKINKTSVSAQVSDYISAEIRSGHWQVGNKIPSENSMCQDLGISRATLRAVISQFAALGILRSVQGKGTFLVTDDLDTRMGSLNSVPQEEFLDIASVLEFRLLIEPQAILWTKRCSEEQYDTLVEKLKSFHQIMVEQIGHPDEFISNDLQFHATIAKYCGNEVLNSALNFIFDRTRDRHLQMNELFGFSHGLKYHEKIIAALSKKDHKKAAQLMHDHLQVAIDKLKEKAE